MVADAEVEVTTYHDLWVRKRRVFLSLYSGQERHQPIGPILGRPSGMLFSAHGPQFLAGPIAQGVATVDEWRFDIVGLLHGLLKDLLGLRTLEPGIDSRRLVGTTGDGEYVSISLKPVGPANSGKFQKWVTLSPAEAEGLVPGPIGWRGLVAMIGLLDSGQPWWVGVYDREDLRATAHKAEQINSRGGGWFYRWDPGILKPILWRDLLAPEEEQDSGTLSDATSALMQALEYIETPNYQWTPESMDRWLATARRGLRALGEHAV